MIRSEVERVMGALSKALGWSEPSKAISLRDWLLQYTQNEAILGIFQTMVSAAMLVNIDELPAQEYFLFIKKLGGYREFGYCPKGSISLPEALLKVIQTKRRAMDPFSGETDSFRKWGRLRSHR